MTHKRPSHITPYIQARQLAKRIVFWRRLAALLILAIGVLALIVVFHPSACVLIPAPSSFADQKNK